MDDADTPRYTVRVVAERVGVPTATLRSWSQRYGVGPPQHIPGRHRLYSENDVAVVQYMCELIAQGSRPRSAARLAIESIMLPRGDVDALLAAAMDLDPAALVRMLEAHIRHFGVLDTWELVVRPAYKSIVELQAESGGCIEVEHALSWAVARAMQRVQLAPPAAPMSVILACTANESHVLALEALRAALGERGYGTLMLGADVPPAALRDSLARVTPPATVVLWSQTARTADVGAVRAVGDRAEVLLGGNGWDSVESVDPGVRVATLGEALDRWPVP
ncbi:MerR family transcriptional regulator [Mycolicibacterium phlei]